MLYQSQAIDFSSTILVELNHSSARLDQEILIQLTGMIVRFQYQNVLEFHSHFR